MIQILDKQNCCGCSSCAQRCPNQCISMQVDPEGFLYPHVNSEICIDCGFCEKVCPMITPFAEQQPMKTLAVVNRNNNTREQSSSGGAFSLIAEKIISCGGVVFGARFDDQWQVILDYTDNEEGLTVFRGSKYLQAQNIDAYKMCEKFLRQGREVLFTGTPCQISGLKHFLRKDYDNLLLVDIVCHGVPSYKVWRSYLDELNESSEEITSVNMRDKSRGWKRYSYKIISANGVLFDDFASKSLYLQGFARNYFLRPSCYNCKSKNGRSQSDITLADFWGIEKFDKSFDDNKGTSAVIVKTKKGQSLVDSLDMRCKEFPFEYFATSNPSYSSSTQTSYYRNFFWKVYSKQGIIAIELTMKKELFLPNRIINKIRKMIGK